jgi:hypothetical protein
MGFWWEDGRTGKMTRPTDNDAVRAGSLERIMTDRHVPSLAASVKKRYPHGKVVSISGHKCYASDAMGTPSADYILCSLIYHDRWVAQAVTGHYPPPGAVNNPRWDVPIPDPSSGFAAGVEQWHLGAENDWVTRYALWTFRRVHYPRLLMMNLPETDVTGHFAVNPAWVNDTLRAHLDRELGSIISAYRKAGILNQTVFVLTSDHGMTRIRDRLPFSVLDRAIRISGATKVFMEADMGAAIGIAEGNKARELALNIALLGGSRVSATMYKMRKNGRWSYGLAAARPSVPPDLQRAYLELANTAANLDGPDVLVMYPPGVTTGDRIVHGYHWLGGHLGAGWDDQHIPLILAGPGVRAGLRSSYPARLVDVAPTVEHLLGAPTGRVDGLVLQDALTHPSQSGLQQQRARAARLRPVVRALQLRSGER